MDLGVRETGWALLLLLYILKAMVVVAVVAVVVVEVVMGLLRDLLVLTVCESRATLFALCSSSMLI